MRAFATMGRLAAGVVLLCALMATAGLAAELRLNRYYTNGMVIQRDKPILVRGVAEKGAAVRVSFAGQEKAGTADDTGAWSVMLDAMPATPEGKKLQVVSGEITLTLSNVVVGDVILFARQTSIDVSLGKDPEGKAAAAEHTTDPLFRALTLKTIPARLPRDDLAPEAISGWTVVDQKEALGMSGAAYYLGRDLAAKTEIPIGIIDLNMGPQFPISWLSAEALDETEKFFGSDLVKGPKARMEKLAALKAEGAPPPPKEVIKSDPVTFGIYPAAGYNAIIHPLRGLAPKAVVLQLGNDYPYMIYADLEKKGTQFDRKELNRAYVETYALRKDGFRTESQTLPRVPREWRQSFGDEDLPIAFVLPPSSALNTMAQHAREMRELQRRTAEESGNMGLIVPGAEYVRYSAQPADEALLAKRAGHWVLGAVLSMDDMAPAGPVFERLETNMSKATIHFQAGTAEGLADLGEGLKQFEVAGVDAEYVPAEATIDGNVIRLSSDKVNRIFHVRYDWSREPKLALVNDAGLPAVPFRTQEAAYHWFVTNEETDLPIEYSTPANEWTSGDVALINGQMKQHGYGNFTGWVGPVGINTGPFGPNMGVRGVRAGSPADGKIFDGDVIYSANGTMLGDKAWLVMADAITFSESEEGGGKLVLGVRRGGKNLDVEIDLPVMGSYSSTAPYDCLKTEKIISNLEQWLIDRNGAADGDAGFLNTDGIFLLATGDPEVQGLVRRMVYGMMKSMDPEKPFEATKAGKSWHNSADAFLLGEYYLATGDRNVLPYLKNKCDRLAATQNPLGGWRHNYPGGATYGLIPNAGLPGVMGMHFALEAGLDINRDSYELGVKHFGDKRAETGFLIYGYGGCERPIPVKFDPEVMMNGKMTSYNGGLSAAGILMEFAGRHRAAHMCSLISAFAWNNTFGGHGGNFWNNFWTPIGAHQHGKAAFVNFWRNHRWYRELNRMYDGGLITNQGGGTGGGTGLALVAPRGRIQVVGAPKSPFAKDAPEVLKPALDAYWAKNYAGCEKIVAEMLDSGKIGAEDRPTVEYLGDTARIMRESIDADLSKMEALIREGRMHEARMDLEQLKAVMPEGDKRLAAVEEGLTGKARPNDVALYQERMNSLKGKSKKAEGEDTRTYVNLTTERPADPKRELGKVMGKVPAGEATSWRLKVVESLEQAPEGWTDPGFDDTAWDKTELPVSWRMYHTALFRMTFEVEDKDAFDGLRFRGWLFRQQGIEIYLNGTLIGKVNNLEKKTGNVTGDFKDRSVELLKNGTNTLAVTTRHNWRWGMLFMKVYNDGFGFMLDARLKEEPQKGAAE